MRSINVRLAIRFYLFLLLTAVAHEMLIAATLLLCIVLKISKLLWGDPTCFRTF